MRRLWIAALLGVVAAGAPAAARELWSRGDASLAFAGELRVLPLFSEGTDLGDFSTLFANNGCILARLLANCPAFGLVNDADVFQNLTRLRLRLEGRLNDRWSGVIAYDNDLVLGKLDTLESGLGDGFRVDSFIGAETEIVDDADVFWSMSLYRAYVRYAGESLEAVVGRQRIPWGVGRLWNPIDRFNAIPPLAIQGDESPGVDAIDLRWSFSGFTYLEAVLAATREWEDKSYALRLHGVLRDIDYSAMVGVFEDALTAGFDLSANLGDAAGRLEVVYADPERAVWPIEERAPGELPAFWQVVAGVDYLFDVGNGVYALVEHLYNGNALGFGSGRAGPLLPFFGKGPCPPALAGLGPCVAPTDVDRLGGSRVVTLSSQLSGLQLRYEVTPEVEAAGLAIYDWDGASASFFPSLRYSPLDWLELTLAAQLFVGPRLSEYGSAPNAVFLLMDVFF